MIDVIDKKSAAIPNASGAKIRVKIGATIIPRPWAITLPEVSLRTLETKLDEDSDIFSKTPLMP
jgi:hypothetical protein